jgi:protein-tyrosine-phosphatase
VTGVLYVCTANICRSAYAEVRTRQLALAGLEAASAGTHGWVDHPMDRHTAAELERRGADPGAFRSRRLTRSLIDDADIVLTATAAHRRFVLEERPGAVKRTFSLGQLAAALGELPPDAEGVDLLAAARRMRATAVADDDVSDPYGQGPDAAAATAAHLDMLLDRVLPRLAS